MSLPPAELSYAQLQARWQSILNGPFSQLEFFEFLIAIHRELPADSLLRVIGHLMASEDMDTNIPIQPLVLDRVTNWPMTVRLDGIMPMNVPFSSDIALVPTWFFNQMDTLGFDLPERDRVGQVEDDISLCFFAWFHQRFLKSSHGMMIELVTLCPRSALSAKEEINVMGLLPNGGRIVIYYSFLKGRDRLTMKESSLEYFDRLEAVRSEDGVLRLAGFNA